jgi:CelD/BcsL family acetyltransferase involved in cellulose biosynthesis
VMHYLAIGRAMRTGFQVYDFLAGEARYKRSLAAPGEALLWCRLQQPRLLFHLERAGRFLRGCLS